MSDKQNISHHQMCKMTERMTTISTTQNMQVHFTNSLKEIQHCSVVHTPDKKATSVSIVSCLSSIAL